MNTTIEPYLYQFYGPEARWFAVFLTSISALTILSNSFFLAITLTSKTIRSKSSTWLLIGFSISELVHGLASNLEAITIWNGSVENRHMCSLAGAFILFTVVCSSGFPFLIAADRFYKIIIRDNNKFSLGITLFSDRFIVPLIIGWYCVSAMAILPLLLTNGFGEDPGGYCATKKFTDVRMLVVYLGTAVSTILLSQILGGVYCFRLVTWLGKQHRTMATEERVRQTKEIMTLAKILYLIPVVFASPVVVLNAGQMLWPDFPMWLQRAIIVPFLSSNLANPWLTITLIRPFRYRVLQLLSKVGIVSRTTTVVNIATQKNVSVQVRSVVVNNVT